MQKSDEETTTFVPVNVQHSDRSSSSAAKEHNPQGVWRQRAEGTSSCAGSEHRAGKTERAQGVSDIVSGAAADPIGTVGAIGFDIETTGVGEDDIVTVACAWSPSAQVTCFNGGDFTPLLEMLDNATLIHTYNGIEFDLPRLAKHCGRASIGPWMRKTVDPLYLIRHTMGFGGCLRLNDLLIANGFEPKSGSGLQAIQFWNEGNRAALSSYCMDDARLTYELCETRNIAWGTQWRIHLWEPKVMQFGNGK
jgi:hypothetical protein